MLERDYPAKSLTAPNSLKVQPSDYSEYQFDICGRCRQATYLAILWATKSENICLDAKRKCGYYAWNNSVVEKVAKVDWVMMA